MGYTLGEPVRLSASFAVDGAPADPTDVTFRVRRAALDVLELTDATTPAVIRDSAGAYHVVVDTPVEGTYFWRAEGTAPAIGAVEGSFFVSSSFF